MDATILAQNNQGGRVIRVYVPFAVLTEAQEITDLVERGELTEEGGARDRWLSRIQPHIDKALAGLEVCPYRDQIALATARSISTLKHPSRLEFPSAAVAASLNRQSRRALASSSRGRP